MLASGDNVDCKPTSLLPYPNGPFSDKISSKAIELANAKVEKVSHLSKEQCTRTCTCKLFYLLATNHVSVQSCTKSVHHKRVTVTTHLPRFFLPITFLMPK